MSEAVLLLNMIGFKLFLAIVTVASVTGKNEQSCTTVNPSEDIDWSQFVGRKFYDAMNMPGSVVDLVNCYDRVNITVVDDGVIVHNRVNAIGYPPQNFSAHFRRVRKGVYIWTREWSDEYMNAMMLALGHKKDRVSVRNSIRQTKAMLHSVEFSFLTDYENYFLTILCTPHGYMTWTMLSHYEPTAQDVVTLWNVLYRHRVFNTIDINEGCLAEKKSNQNN